jgi:hypothetical protein
MGAVRTAAFQAAARGEPTALGRISERRVRIGAPRAQTAGISGIGPLGFARNPHLK